VQISAIPENSPLHKYYEDEELDEYWE